GSRGASLPSAFGPSRRDGGRRHRRPPDAPCGALHAELEQAEPGPPRACEEEAVAEHVGLRVAVDPRPVADRDLDDPEHLLRGAEEQEEVTEGVGAGEERALALDRLVVPAEERLRPAERVPDALPENPREEEAENFVAEVVERAHRLALHRVDEARAVRELAHAVAQRGVELRQVLGRDGEIAVEDHQDVAARSGESLPNPLALAGRTALVDQSRRAL